MTDLLVLLLMSLTAYRVARFFVLDTMFGALRERFLDWLSTGEDVGGDRRPINPHADPVAFSRLPLVRRKAYELLTCPFCFTVYTAAGAVAVWDLWGGSLPMPVYWWLAVAAGALIVWRIIDWEDD